MKTYQDLERTPETERGSFCISAVNEFKSSREYKEASDGEAYYAKHNLTIEAYQRTITTLSGQTKQDIWSANYKLKTLFFRRLVMQIVQYILGNGVSFINDSTKEKLGKDFDYQLQRAAKHALAAGRSFGFWNNDHLEVFGYADTKDEAGYCPLYSEEDGEMYGGVRFWRMSEGDLDVRRYTLYEPDGYTTYIKPAKEDIREETPKQAYKHTIVKSAELGVETVIDENYGKLPIVQLVANDIKQSELVGIRECIDCYDFVKSGLANNIDDNSEFYWILKNTGGMDDVDLAKFIQRMKTVRAAVVDGDQDATAEAHTLNVPIEARSRMLEILRADIYEDFQALDVNTLSAAQKTTQEIQAAYQAQDNKAADFQYYIERFVNGILSIIGIEDDPSFKWNKILNMQEQTQTIMMAAQYLTDDVIITKLPFLTPEEADKIIGERDADMMGQFSDDMEEEGFGDTSGIDSMLENLIAEIEGL